MTAARVGWSLGLLAVLAGPAFLRLGPGTGAWLQLAELTGLVGMSGLVVTTVLPSRLRALTRAFGVDGTQILHRTIGAAVVGLVLVHLACVIAADPTAVRLLNPTTATPAALAAMAATLALAALLTLTVTRARQRYEAWRWVHLALTGAAVAGTALHVWLLGRLVTDPVMAPVFAVLGATAAAVAAARWLWRPRDPTAEFVVAGIRARSSTVSSVYLEPARSRHRLGEPPMRMDPGQFAWLRLAQRAAAEEHPFTIASAADARLLEFLVRHRGDFTRSLHALLPGRRVWLDGPHGAFTVSPTVGRVALVAGGVGLAPMLSILRTAADRNDRRPHLLIQYASHDGDILCRGDLEQLRPRLDLTLIEAVYPDPLHIVIGRVPRLDRWDWYVCGSPQMVAATETALAAHKVLPDRIHTEKFD